MKISDYSVQSTSAHKLEQNTQTTQQLQIWTNQNEAAVKPAAQQDDEPSYLLELSEHDMTEFSTQNKYAQCSIDTESYLEQEARIKLKLIEKFIFHTTGKMMHLKNPVEDMYFEEYGIELPGYMPEVQQSQSWGMTYDYREVFEEMEQVEFRFAGSVKTESGKEFQFDLQFGMSRQHYEESGVSIRMGDAARVDPLVVVYDGTAPELTDARQAFDLDADGEEEMIAMPGEGSGFLALDKNKNGRIDDGSELFGPENGDGFEALRAYDEDANGWIDESDAVFGQLSIMKTDAQGQQTLFRLGEMGIGAIYLHEVATQFGMKNAVDDKGMMQASSVFLRENGTAGTIHHIDLSL